MKKIVFAFTFLISCINILAQERNYIPNLIPPSPNAASIGKFGNIPLNFSSGLPTINIPLYSLLEGGISVPVSLTYNYSGFRPSEEISPVGRGWSLQTGGVITRVIKGGIEDEWVGSPGGGYLVSGSKLAYAMSAETGIWNCNANTNSQCIAFGDIGEKWDGEPDIFHFSFGDISGKFFFGADGQIHIVSERKLKIEYLSTSYFYGYYTYNGKTKVITHWQITSEDGTKYKFGFINNNDGKALNVEYSLTRKAGYEEEIINSWYLYEIESPKKEKVTFSYANDFIEPALKNITKVRLTLSCWESYMAGQGGNNFTDIMYMDENSNSTPFSSYFPGSRSTENVITEINGTNFKVKFNYIEKEEIISNYLIYGGKTTYKLLKSVDLYTKTLSPELVKSFKLIQNQENRKAFLDTLKEVNSANILEKAHTFEYYGTIPDINGLTRKTDFWNYYNASSNTSFNPNTANREPSLEPTKIGALKKIIYPTGGSSTFVYELNDFSYVRENLYTASDNVNTHLRTIGGLRIKSITDETTGSIVTKSYTYRDFDNSSLSSGVVSEVMIPYAYKIPVQVSCSNFTGAGTSFFESIVTKILTFGIAQANCPPNNTVYYSIYKSEPFYSMASTPVYYKNVIESLSNDSKTYYTFTSHLDFPDFLGVSYGLSNNSVGAYSTREFARSLPKNIKYYSGTKLISETTNQYILDDKYKTPVMNIEPVFTRSSGETYVRAKGLNVYSGFLKKVSEKKVIYDQ
ncbi:hypothetical protein [Arcicella lustrica]|uniref:YD repeat-containing protein n=1 Tax=Arcicella lustrica TaxID=2984196 RepID=A0ABU5SPC4_9BACT|nr:hypothetical protein [Arcicella sp. DC25W]MEA5429120.1 hypothetical protein [Arcicella sp. DC25W]